MMQMWTTLFWLALCAISAVGFRRQQRAAPGSVPDVGIWYSTWYTNQGKYVWNAGHGSGSSKQFLADVDGDGKDDAVVFFGTGGLAGYWYASTSTGDAFNPYSRWVGPEGPLGAGSTAQFLKDVDGDGKADAVVFNSGAGKWFVAASTGSKFTGIRQWLQGSGVGSSAQFLEDMNNDGLADAVYYFAADGCWYVALSTGSSFAFEAQWMCGHGVGSEQQMVADVDGDGQGDAVVRFGNARYVALSQGNRLGAYSLWGNGGDCSLDGKNSMLADYNGDGKADNVVFNPSEGKWCVGLSTGSGFANGQVRWVNHVYGQSKWELPAVTSTFIARPAGGSTVSAVAFSDSTGAWRVLPKSIRNPTDLNLWEYWGIPYKPLEGQYDSGTPEVALAHAQALDSAGVDFLLYDMTNHVGTSFILQRAKAVSAVIAGESSLNLRYAVAGGGMQFTNDPQTLETEAEFVWNQFVTDPVLGTSYYKVDGKPFLAMHSSWALRQSWERLGDHQWSDKFHLKWISGSLPGSDGNPPLAYRGQYVGWGLTQGTQRSSENMVVMPGWDNHLGSIVQRQNGQYYERCWDEVFAQVQAGGLERVIINSYNEYAEQTAVGPADTSDAPYTWPNATYYWDRTVSHLQQLGKARN